MADLRRNANITKSNSEIKEETLFGGKDESFLMDVSVDGHAELIRELTDASRNKGAYAMREAISNAIDATVRAGVDRPVEVSVPSGVGRSADAATLADKLLSRTPGVHCVTVTDYGTGMSADELRENFAQYGNSDKRGSGLIGSKGLGAKAPLACSDYFEVESTKDGRHVKMALWREEDGNYARIVSNRKTSAESGTTVRIPVMSEDIRSEMEKTARQMASWSTEILVRLDGPSLTADKRRLGKELGRTYKPVTGERGSYAFGRYNRGNTEDYVFMGSFVLGEDSVDVWRRLNDVGTYVNMPEGFHDNVEIDINLMGSRYPLLRNGSVGSSLSMSGQTPEYIIGCKPGYLNFTVSRDDIKEDDAWRRFVSALREGLAEFNQWPATLRHIAGTKDFADRIQFMRSHGIAIIRKGGRTLVTQHGAEQEIAEEQAREILSVTGEDGKVTDMFDVLVADLDDDPAEGDGMTVMAVYDGNMHAFTIDSDGFAASYDTKMAVKNIRDGLEHAARKSNLCTLLVPFHAVSYWYRNKVENLRILVLTHMGNEVGRFATGDRIIRKAHADGGRPADASLLYILCEGDFCETPGTKALFSQFPKGYEVSRYDDFLRACKTGVNKQKAQEDAERAEREREAQRKRDIRFVMVVHPGTGRSVGEMDTYQLVEEGIDTVAHPRTAYSAAAYRVSYDNVDFGARSDSDLLVIKNGDPNPGAVAMAYALLERAGKVRRYSRIIIIQGVAASEWGLYGRLLGNRDVLYDSEARIRGLAADAMTVDDAGRVQLHTDAIGLSRPDEASMAAVLLGDERISPRCLRAVHSLTADTGDSSLDGILGKYDFGQRVEGNRNWYYTSTGRHPRALKLVPSVSFEKAMDHTYKAAQRLSEAWDAGMEQLVLGAWNDSLPDAMTVDDVKSGLRAVADA